MKLARLILIALLIVTPAISQQQVMVVDGPATQRAFTYSGNNLTVVCEALSTVTTGLRAATKISITSATQASPTVLTATGHGFTLSTRPSITISGVTGTGYTGINTTWVATVVDANTFSIPFDSSLLSAPTLTNAVFTTTAPRSTMPEWKVQKLFYDGSNNLITTVWLNGTGAFASKCSDASSTTLVLQ